MAGYKERANKAIDYLLKHRQLDRAFDNCFEMFDGDSVYMEVMRQADSNPLLVEAIQKAGLGYWLEQEYRSKTASKINQEESHKNTLLIRSLMKSIAKNEVEI